MVTNRTSEPHKRKDRYYCIDQRLTHLGVFALWENCYYGDTAPAILTLNNVKVGFTNDDLDDAINDYYEGGTEL